MSNDNEFYDMIYDIWRGGGNPDALTDERFEYEYEGNYDFLVDTGKLRTELKRQRGNR